MICIDKTAPKTVALLDSSNEDVVMPVLELLDAELKAHGLEFVITKDVLANGNTVKMVEVRKKMHRRTRKSKKGLLG